MHSKIKSKQEYQEVLSKIEELFDAKPNTKEGDELDRLVKIIEDYENENYPI